MAIIFYQIFPFTAFTQHYIIRFQVAVDITCIMNSFQSCDLNFIKNGVITILTAIAATT